MHLCRWRDLIWSAYNRRNVSDDNDIDREMWQYWQYLQIAYSRTTAQRQALVARATSWQLQPLEWPSLPGNWKRAPFKSGMKHAQHWSTHRVRIRRALIVCKKDGHSFCVPAALPSNAYCTMQYPLLSVQITPAHCQYVSIFATRLGLC